MAGFTKAEVLLHLYNNVTYQGPAFDHMSPMTKNFLTKYNSPGNIEKAEDMISNGRTYFDYADLDAGSRPVYVDLSKDHFDPTEYNRAHGQGHAERIINKMMCATIFQVKNPKPDPVAALQETVLRYMKQNKSGVEQHESNDPTRSIRMGLA